ncbi:formyltransferase family protein [Dietzia sp. SYD-A1]|uniref:formyltransferase family protein n=1 Tax=Dietzia sp. SYD-A1 TaxID=2780141 RepID=UPI001891B53B|nr:formyltransferase family protein [Dietzia sp. SYD-A1]
MRFGFVTCVELGLSCIEEIFSVGGNLDLLVTLHDHKSATKSGRIYLDDIARHHGVPLVKVNHINDAEAVAAIRDAKLDWLFVIGWSQIASRDILDSTSKGVLGMHPTLLPVGRGRAAVPWAIIKGLPKTGVTLFALDAGVDTGPIVDQVEVPIAPDETATTLYAKVNEAHKTLIRKAWPALTTGRCDLRHQDEARATEWQGRRPEDGRITQSMTVAEVDKLVRGVTRPYPGAFWDEAGRRVRVWAGTKSAEKEGAMEIHLSDGCYFATDYEWEPTP